MKISTTFAMSATLSLAAGCVELGPPDRVPADPSTQAIADEEPEPGDDAAEGDPVDELVDLLSDAYTDSRPIACVLVHQCCLSVEP